MSEPSVFTMPSLGADMEEGTVLRWFRQPGDEVRRGDLVALIDTEKAEIEIEIFHDGIIGELLVLPGTKVPVGAPLATVLPSSPVTMDGPRPRHKAAPLHSVSVVDEAVAPAPTPARAPAPRRAPASAAPAAARGRRVRSSPRARRLAAVGGVDLRTVPGSGPHGAVVSADLGPGRALHPAGAEPSTPPSSAPPEGRRAANGPDRRARDATARLMARAKREIPHYYLGLDVELEDAMAWLRTTNLERSPAERVLPAALLLRASALAARAFPELNGFWLEDRFVPADAVHLGVAISVRGGGLVAPAILDADRLGVEELMASLRDLVARSRRGALRSSEMSEPTITVTNLGDTGVNLVYGVIHPPQVAMVGFGRITERAWAEDGMVGARPVVTVTLAADHRATDGHIGARFLSAIADHLADPHRLAVEDHAPEKEQES